MSTTRVELIPDLVTDASDHILKYHLGELDLDIDLTRNSNETGSGTSLQPQSKADPHLEAPEQMPNAEMPFRWFPELKSDCLQFDEAFSEEYLLGHEQFGRIMENKLSFFFEGRESVTRQTWSRRRSRSGF